MKTAKTFLFPAILLLVVGCADVPATELPAPPLSETATVAVIQNPVDVVTATVAAGGDAQIPEEDMYTETPRPTPRPTATKAPTRTPAATSTPTVLVQLYPDGWTPADIVLNLLPNGSSTEYLVSWVYGKIEWEFRDNPTDPNLQGVPNVFEANREYRLWTICVYYQYSSRAQEYVTESFGAQTPAQLFADIFGMPCNWIENWAQINGVAALKGLSPGYTK